MRYSGLVQLLQDQDPAICAGVCFCCSGLLGASLGPVPWTGRALALPWKGIVQFASSQKAQRLFHGAKPRLGKGRWLAELPRELTHVQRLPARPENTLCLQGQAACGDVPAPGIHPEKVAGAARSDA